MSAIRGVLRDLVERKLWPIAVLLLAAGFRTVELLGPSDDDCRPDNNRRPLLTASK